MHNSSQMIDKRCAQRPIAPDEPVVLCINVHTNGEHWAWLVSFFSFSSYTNTWNWLRATINTLEMACVHFWHFMGEMNENSEILSKYSVEIARASTRTRTKDKITIQQKKNKWYAQSVNNLVILSQMWKRRKRRKKTFSIYAVCMLCDILTTERLESSQYQ